MANKHELPVREGDSQIGQQDPQVDFSDLGPELLYCALSAWFLWFVWATYVARAAILLGHIPQYLRDPDPYSLGWDIHELWAYYAWFGTIYVSFCTLVFAIFQLIGGSTQRSRLFVVIGFSSSALIANWFFPIKWFVD